MDNTLGQNDVSKLPIDTTERDWFLQTIVNMANGTSDYSLFGITIVTHGFLVSGQLISGLKYFNGFANDLASGFSDSKSESASSIKEIIINIGKTVYDKRENDKDEPSPTYIHLENAKFYHPNGNPIPGNTGVFWRGRISEVSGFSLGLLAVETN